ncbi:MAG: hypothetical protein KC994_18145, partial [Candidatus Omnitrophica bacterium]|nr:hypothetical protein [Candidatus Omnitrophota bacterium]
ETLVVAAPDVVLRSEGGSILFQGVGLAPHDPLLKIASTATDAQIVGLTFRGSGVPVISKGIEGQHPDFEFEIVGAVGLSNEAEGTLLSECAFYTLGSGGFGGGGAVVSGRENESVTIRLDDCMFEENSVGVRTFEGSLQMFECEAVDTTFADIILYGEGEDAISGEIMDCSFTTEDRDDGPYYRLFAAGSPSDLSVSGTTIGQALISNVVSGDGVLDFNGNRVYNLGNSNVCLMTIASLSAYGIPAEATIDQSDLYIHHHSMTAWVFGELENNALILAGEVDDGDGAPIAPCRLTVVNSILGGDEGGERGIAFHRVGDSTESYLSVTHSLLVTEGDREMGQAILGEADEMFAIESEDPFYADVFWRNPGTNLDFHYSKNSVAATLGDHGQPIGSRGPDDTKGLWLAVPDSILPQNGLLTFPITLDDASGVASIEMTLYYDATRFYSPPLVQLGDFAEHMNSSMETRSRSWVDLTLTTSEPATTPREATLYFMAIKFLPTPPYPTYTDLEFQSATIKRLSGVEFRVQARDGLVDILSNTIPGNADLNGVLDMRDVVTVLRHIVRIEEMGPDGIEAADVVDPGELAPPEFVDPISIDDAVWIYQAVTGETKKSTGSEN